MKKVFTLLFTILAISILSVGLFSVEASAVPKSGKTGDCTWTLDGTKLTISGKGYMENYEADYLEEEDYFLTIAPWGDEITEVSILDGVRSVGDYAFTGCKLISKVTVPESLLNIGDWSFAYCEGLETIVIPKNVEEIGNHPFLRCKKLKSAYYNATEASKTTNQPIFNSCDSLKEIYISEGVEKIPRGAFWNCSSVTEICIPNTVQVIESNAFAACESLTSVTIPESVKEIYYDAFTLCSGVIELNYNASSNIDLGEPGWHLFSSFSNLKVVNIGENVKSIPPYAFYACRNLETVFLYKNVKNIYSNAFSECRSLKNICYGGSTEDANNIYIGESNTRLTMANWYYNFCTLNGLESHTYSGTCDNECDCCKWWRKSDTEHKYTDACDGECNECGVLRDAPHTYDYKCDSYCDNCGYTRPIVHTYLDEYDETCDVCNSKRFYVAYDINYGVEIFDIQYKAMNERVVLISSVPTRAGYNFAGWSTSKNGDPEYQPSDSYSANKSTTLYAQWNLHCDSCEGKGTRTVNCSTCNGSGEVYSHKYACSNCNDKKFYCCKCGRWGNGNILSMVTCSCGSNTWYWCEWCDGTGGDIYYKDCSACQGSGKVKKDCTKCNASGEVVRQSVSAPSIPVLERIDSNTIVLQEIENGEYSLDGVNWQESTVFENLESDKTYTVYQRYAKTDTTFKSENSEALTVMLVSYTPGDLDGVPGVSMDDAIYLLFNINFPGSYPVNQPLDFDGNGEENMDDAIYLLFHVNFPDSYPLH